MCLILSSEIRKRIIFKVHAPRHGLFYHLQTSPPFARPFRRPLTPVFRRTGTSPSVRVSLPPVLSFIRHGRQTQIPARMHKQHFLCSFVPSPANGTTPFLPATPNILGKGSLLLSFSPSLLPPLSALFSRRFTINTCQLTSAASTVSNLKCQFQKLRRPYGQPAYRHPPADADVQTIKKGDTANRRTPFSYTYRLVNRYFPFLQTREQPSPHLCPAFSARNADRRFC